MEETKRVIEGGKVHWSKIPGEIIESIGKEIFRGTNEIPEVRMAPLPAELMALELPEAA
jgi:hypothetical protein